MVRSGQARYGCPLPVTGWLRCLVAPGLVADALALAEGGHTSSLLECSHSSPADCLPSVATVVCSLPIFHGFVSSIITHLLNLLSLALPFLFLSQLSSADPFCPLALPRYPLLTYLPEARPFGANLTKLLL